jgi:hypothetical protein
MKKIKHSKFKNTGILFELLVRQITLEVLNGDKTEKARKIVSTFFGKNTELSKEIRLYELLTKEKYSSENRAEKFIDTVTEAYGKLNHTKLLKEKYNLIKEIKSNFELDKFLTSPITNYKVLASAYKVFESKLMESYDIKDIFNSKTTLIENITSKPVSSKVEIKDKLVETYKTQEKDLRLLAYKILVEKFNNKYQGMSERQKDVLKEYITNISDTKNLKVYLNGQLDQIKVELNELKEVSNDPVVKIKLEEVLKFINPIKENQSIKDEVITGILQYFDLIDELKKH